MVAVTFALPQESRSFVAKLKRIAELEAGALPLLTGELDERQVVICHTGVGTESAEKKVRALIEKFQPRVLISSGFAGALSPELKTGDVVVARNFSKENLVRQFPEFRAGTFATSSELIDTAAGKRELHRSSGALAVDMETEVIHRVCIEYETALLAVRVISDTAEETLPVPFEWWFDLEQQTPRPLSLVKFLIARPGKIATFVQFVHNVAIARRAIGTELVRIVRALSDVA